MNPNQPPGSPSHHAPRKGQVLDTLLAGALAVFAVGNLALPKASQTILGLDYLLLASAVIAIVVVVRLKRLLDQRYTWGVVLVISISALPGLLMLAPTEYGTEKSQALILLLMVALAPASFRNSRKGTRLTLIIVSSASLLFAAFLLVYSTVTSSGRVSVLSLNPVGAARMTGIFVVTGLAVVVASHLRSHLRLAVLAGAVLCAIATLITGSRGPVLSIIVSLTVVVALTLRTRHIHFRALAFGLGTMMLAMIFVFESNMAGIARVLDGGDSGRSGIYSFTLDQAVANPEGAGWGGFAGIAWRWGSQSDRIYPHNLLLEVFVEGGFIALLGFVVLLTYAAWHGARSYLRSKDRVECVALSLFIYALVNAQFSSDLVGNRLLWVSLGLVLALSHRTHGSAPVPLDRHDLQVGSVGRERMHGA